MNLKSTLLLIVLLVAGATVAWFGPSLAPMLDLAPAKPDSANARSLDILRDELTQAKVTYVAVSNAGKTVTLERTGLEWSLPGKWPTRKPEVEALIQLLTSLRSRFEPIPIQATEPAELKKYGLDKPAVSVVIRSGNEQYRLEFGEESPTKATELDGKKVQSSFARPTYLRINDKPEVIRLEPGIIAQLSKPLDYFQQRRLFPSEPLAKPGEGQERKDHLTATGIEARQKAPEGNHYSLVKKDDTWQLKEPVKDRVDPDKLNTVLAGVPDLWAEKFVANAKKDLAEYGLKEPEDTLAVTLPDGDTRILQIGKISDTKVRHVTRPSPPGLPPQPPSMDTVTEEFRFAKLQNNDQIFEIKADKLKDIFVPAKELRDPRLARFETKDVHRVEVIQPEGTIVVVKDKGWKLEKPHSADAEESKVTDLLDKLSRLEARDQDIVDSKELAKFGLDKPAATVKVIVEEETKGDKKKTAKTYTFTLGKDDLDKKKVYVSLQGWDRINAVDDSVMPLVKRPELAYRGRRVMDFLASALEGIDIERANEKVSLKQDKGAWKLTAPTQADADGIAAGQLASSLGGLESAEYVSEAPKPEDLDKLYGLAKPSLSITAHFADKNKPAQTLLVGKQREGKPGYYAKLASAPGVFVIRKDSQDSLDKGSLAYRPLQLWQVLSTDVASLKVQKEGHDEYTLNRKGTDWQITGPFDAPALMTLAQPMIQELAGLKCERYETHASKELPKYGLDKPYLRVALVTAPKKAEGPAKPDDKKEPAEAPKERILLIGKSTGGDAKTRFAKLANEEAIFVVNDKLIQALDHDALALLDRKLLNIPAQEVDSIKVTGSATPLLLQKKGTDWHVLETPAPEFTSDPEIMAEMLNVWGNLRAEKFAAYGPKANLAEFGLDKPSLTLTIKGQGPDKDGKKSAPAEHTLILGKPVGNTDERYARVDNGPGVAILGAATVKDLKANYLDYVDRTVFNLDPEAIKELLRKEGNNVLDVAKRDEGWQILKPSDLHADEETLQKLTTQLSHLRASRVAAYPAKELKDFGLDMPSAVLTLKVAGPDGKPGEKILNLGKPADEKSGDRFAQAAGSQAVVVLPISLIKQLIAAPLAFRDRKLVRFADADKLILERGARKAVFTKVDGTWKLTEPAEAQAEQGDLEEFINEAARLQADELVAEKPADLKPFGLDKPESHWRFLSGDKTVLNLEIGAKDQTGNRVHAKLVDGSLVFLLKPSMTAKVKAEYRNRIIWPSAPDAAQVESLQFGYAKSPFTLEKIGGQWQVAGKPEFKVDAKAVNDTLAAIAGLKVDQFVVDKDAPHQLYGLDKPQLALSIATPSGPKTLLIGTQEGGSKRYYAQVPEKKGEVFVIAEADAGRIVRDLAAFKEKEAKGAGANSP